MARSPKRYRKVYWDSCAWIAQIRNEKVPLPDGTIENRGALCRAVIDDAVKREVDIFTSALALVEVSKQPPGTPEGNDKLRDFFENDYIVIIQLDRRLGGLARDLMQKGYAGLKPPDAVHLASAALSNVEEMHTFDDKLLGLNEKVTKADGTLLNICKPSMGGPTLPLLESGSQNDEAGTTGTRDSEIQGPQS